MAKKKKKKKRKEGHSIERVWSTASREPSDTPPDRNYLAFASKGISSTTPWVGPINAALKRLKLATATPGATSTLSASSASLFLCRFSDVFGTALLVSTNQTNQTTESFPPSQGTQPPANPLSTDIFSEVLRVDLVLGLNVGVWYAVVVRP